MAPPNVTEAAAFQIAIVGSPNAGKTSVFNSLTGVRSRTANYPGVTVSRREATVEIGGRMVELVDLPGTYGLEPISPDEAVVSDALHGRLEGFRPPDALVMIADATSLDRSLFLLAEFLELGLPTCLVLTMVDEVAVRHGSVDLTRLSDALGIPVVGVIGHRGVGMATVKGLLVDPHDWIRPIVAPPDTLAERTAWIDSIIASVVAPLDADERTRRIDSVLLHPVWGPAAFIAVMLAFFQSIFTLATPAVDWLETVIGDFSDWVRDNVGGTFGDLLADGVIAGVGGVLVFVPQIALLFLIIGLLERVGYLARAALMADRVMGRFGLEGRSFIAMLSSFACAVPGIMSARTIPNERDRIVTMMAAPLMTCSARLPVFTLLIAAFVPNESAIGPLRSQGLALFGLYLLGALSGLVYSAVLSKTMLGGPTAPFMMELPAYRRPTATAVLLHVWDGVWSFARKAGTVILGTTIILWVLLSLPNTTPPDTLSEAEQASYEMEHSIAGRAGKALEPVLAPLGFEWRTNVALIGSLAAREVFVSTLAITTASEDEDALADRIATLENSDGSRAFDGPTVVALLIFFVYALQCFSTVAVLHRETNSWRWPAIAMSSMLGIAYVAALIGRSIAELL
ncbi:MAG: ferrous iron transporter B [Actinomycetia bacterium]|nr:ferrous iron transporter B [Actinomycetes bacterium]